MASKINSELLEKSVADILTYAEGGEITVAGETVKGKKRNFTETIDLQIGLKNFDPARDKRFSGTFKLPHIPRPNMKICILGNAKHCEEAERLELPFMSVEDLKKFNKQKKLVKKFAKKYHAFLASDSLIKQIPRLLGPGLTKAGKFPVLIAPGQTLQEACNQVKQTIKFQAKKVTCLNVAVANCDQSAEEIALNVQLASNFLASLLKKNWQNIKVLYIKSSMGPRMQIYF